MPLAMTTKLALTRIRPDRNERRFYRLEVTVDLFGTILLLRSWGRLGTDGQRRSIPYPDLATAAAALTSLAESKRRRGYVEVSG